MAGFRTCRGVALATRETIQMSHENIHYSVEDRVATITIDRPERRNAMTHAMNAEYARLIRKAGDDGAVQVLVVTGADGAFCAGTDLSDFDTQTPRERSGNAAEHTPGLGWWRWRPARSPRCVPSTARRSAWAPSSRVTRTHRRHSARFTVRTPAQQTARLRRRLAHTGGAHSIELRSVAGLFSQRRPPRGRARFPREAGTAVYGALRTFGACNCRCPM